MFLLRASVPVRTVERPIVLCPDGDEVSPALGRRAVDPPVVQGKSGGERDQLELDLAVALNIFFWQTIEDITKEETGGKILLELKKKIQEIKKWITDKNKSEDDAKNGFFEWMEQFNNIVELIENLQKIWELIKNKIW